MADNLDRPVWNAALPVMDELVDLDATTTSVLVAFSNDTRPLVEVAAGAAETDRSEGRFVVQDDQTAEWAMRVVRAAADDIAEATHDLSVWQDQLERWFNQRTTRSRIITAYLGDMLSTYQRARREADERNKTLVLPSGRVKTSRPKNTVLVNDEDLALKWAKTNAPDAVKTVESLMVSKLPETIQLMVAKDADGVITDTWVVDTNGNTIPGLAVKVADLSVQVVPGA